MDERWAAECSGGLMRSLAGFNGAAAHPLISMTAFGIASSSSSCSVSFGKNRSRDEGFLSISGEGARELSGVSALSMGIGEEEDRRRGLGERRQAGEEGEVGEVGEVGEDGDNSDSSEYVLR